MPSPVPSRLALTACLLLAAACGQVSDHGHAHPHDEAAPADELEPLTVTLFGERVLLFLEYPRLVCGEPARFLAHFSVLQDGAPVRSGRVRLEIGSQVLVAAGPKRDGLFVPEGNFAQAGEYPAAIVLEGGVGERLDLGMVTVHADLAAARAAAELGDAPAGDGVAFLMEQQWQARVLFAQAGPARLVRRLAVPARTLLAEGAAAVASAPVPGRLVGAAEDGALPRTGRRVAAGELLAFVEPLISAPEAAQWRALELELARQSLDVERTLAEADARLQLAERERERTARLRADGLATQAQLEAAQAELSVARITAEAAGAARAALGSWTERHAGGASAAGGAPRVAVTAPLSGEVTEAGHVLGESVAAGEALFRIVDASRLWIEGRLSEYDLPRLASAPAAVVSLAAQPDLRIPVGGPGAAPPWVAPEVDPATRTVAIRYGLPNAEGRLRAGQAAELLLELGEAEAAVTVPEEAIVMDQGQPTAWVMVTGEEFRKRVLRLGLRDGGRVEVLEGLAAGEHVATRGAADIRLAALSPASFGAGHAH